MTLQTMLYFSSILLTCGLTGFLAWYAWRQPPLPGVRAYAWLAFCECLMALTDIISMLSGTQAGALFWFNLRFIFTAVIPVIFLVFALAYSGQKGWLSKKLLAGALVVPFITQVMLWSNSLHGLWVKHEVGFHQNGPLWIAETGARIPGLWFLVHSFYSQIFMLAGIVLIFLVAWRMMREQRGQALLLIAGALVGLMGSLIPTFNLIPQAEFNTFIPGIGISALLYALAIFRFQFLKHAPVQESAARMTHLDAREKGSLAILILIFVLFASGVVAAGYLTYQNYEKQYRLQVESQLSSIADLKVSGLENWRAERVADAETLYNNPAFETLVQMSLENPGDAQAGAQLQTWLDTIRNSYRYDRVFLLDTGGIERVSSPAAPEPVAAHLTQEAAAIIHSDQVTFLDFHRDSPDGKIHLALLVPIYAERDSSRPLGLLVLRIDPNVYLYPYLNQWPTSGTTAETLLVRRDGNDALFLNELKFEQDTALNLRIPLAETQVLAVKAALGQTGIVEGLDYRGQPVIGYVCAVPGSPWFLVARMDTAEVYAPLTARLWQTYIFFGMLILATGAGLMLVWRQQRVHYYRAQVETMEALHDSQAQVIGIVNSAMDAIITVNEEQKIIIFNPSAEQMFGCSASQAIGQTLDRFLPESVRKEHEEYLRVFGQSNSTKRSMKTPALMLTCLRTDGEAFPSEVSISQLEIGGQKLYTAIVRDITERVQAEEKLIASEVRYRRLFEAARDGILILDAETGVVIDVNVFLIEMLGFSHEVFLGKKIWELGFFKDIAMNKANFLELQQKEYIHYEGLPMETADGRSIQVEFVSHVYQVNHHKVVQCNVRDITERKKAEDALRVSETLVKTVLDNLPIGIAVNSVDPAVVFSYMNDNFTKFYRTTRENLAEPNAFWSAVYEEPDFREELMKRVLDDLASGDTERMVWIDVPITRRGEETTYITARDIPIPDKPLTISTVWDVTERVRAEEALVASRKLMQDIADNSAPLIFAVDTEGRFLLINRQLESVLGAQRETLIGKTRAAVLPAEIAALHRANDLQVIETRQPITVDEENKEPDGKHTYLSYKFPLFDANGNVYGVGGISTDITERKRAEEEVRLLNVNLEQRVEERTRELREAHEQLVRQERLATLGQLAGSVGHELRNPLGVISNAIYFLKMSQPDATDIVKEYLEIINNETRTSNKIVADLLDFTRIKSVDREPASVSELAAQTLERYPVPPSVKVALELPADLPRVYADPLHVVQVLGNLTVNACQAMVSTGSSGASDKGNCNSFCQHTR